MSPIAFVGTHKDLVNDPGDHERISTALHDAFHSSLAWDFWVLRDNEGEGQRGRTMMNFFPVDNKLGRRDPAIGRLMAICEDTMSASSYVKQRIPLTWLKCLDTLKATHKNALALQEVNDLAVSCHVKTEDIPSFLRFMRKV